MRNMDVAHLLSLPQGFIMAIRYYDNAIGRERVKPRYKWAAIAFAAGMIFGVVCGHIL
jgi:hypothetical protein